MPLVEPVTSAVFPLSISDLRAVVSIDHKRQSRATRRARRSTATTPIAMTTSTSQPRLDHVQCLDASGLHRMAYWEWGDPANPRVLVCVHGLSRQGRDFDTLARAMQDSYRVICPDVVGRGQSDFLANPVGYQVPSYVADMVTLLARLNAREVHWVGTSMGGLIGIGAGGAARTRRSHAWCSTMSDRRSAPRRWRASAAISACRCNGRASKRRPTIC